VGRILVIEDNEPLAFGLRNSLQLAGHEVEVRNDGPTGLQAARAAPVDLVILDIMLPRMDGYSVLRGLRNAGSTVPVLILTARMEESDKVRGLQLGADDYVTKPFGIRELLARIEARLRRQPVPAFPLPPLIQFGDIEVALDARQVRRAGRLVDLTPREYDLLVALIRGGGRPLARSELLRTIWGYDPSVASRTVDTHIFELRRKLEVDAGSPRCIVTVHKTGYRLQC
jgi:DNA-binding response OmpR family regulator